MILGQLCVETMRLEYLTRVIQPVTLRGATDCEIEGLAYDSRQVRPGFLFVALPGQRRDGRDFVAEAIDRGAVAVMSEKNELPRRAVTCIRVEDARRAMAEVACALYGEPSRDLFMVGVTGTNGKSTVSFMVRDLLRAAGLAPGLIGTIRYEIGERSIPASRTTPEAPDLQAMLDRMRRAGCRSAVMEVSSHGLDQKRVWGTDFDVGIFTNLTQDHLDYHRTMDRYYAAKSLLFRGLGQMEKSARAVLNMDDPWGLQLANTGGFNAELLTFGMHPGAMVRAENVELSDAGSTFDVATPWGGARVSLRLLGRFNVSNALAALAAGGAAGVPPAQMAEVLGAMRAVPGRLEPIPAARPFRVYVDYAHTPDALTNVLRTLREFTAGRVIVVFGCGGDRDRAKRPMMGAAAASLADYSVVTSDNPRSELPADIIAEIVPGFGEASNFEIEENREKAVFKALRMARAGDTVLIAGKGHETTQEIGNTISPFDDREVARRLLENL
ncbi:MAG TPA: UDP-N-acetylmuramoyl-L-alanyl-D-glutamate--2,6-diaminopimelate ligase [Kiritimatiellia bacterium]|nr:UDP-N-acetylmuramoyl-L-alanyl-D-glutamate--2,6-diaminopimelate ligase [Kiritimatiellia bacterium]HSA19710.1 UDP-N-acetylmuramoyl-L-alanyl-D-glutamate--2,6-diaminopimelate ligase [Kiritimatiellia bacterium]